ncbi:FeoB-associated Cys-rich membrane protein [Clostridium sp. WILCCON 0269]|uniref:FeoB-associated Cys-rich membrane protein n=1 Tax=Candidatus Clostridium eludens TaxID=3381663 RepID=A0ABW8SNV8_9CLOT
MSTVIVGVILFGIIGFAGYKTYKSRKGGSGCGCGCSGCNKSENHQH